MPGRHAFFRRLQDSAANTNVPISDRRAQQLARYVRSEIDAARDSEHPELSAVREYHRILLRLSQEAGVGR
jgi:hypothetical protein